MGEEDIEEAVELIEDGDVEGLMKKAKKCHKGGEESEGEESEGDDGEDKPARGEGEKPAKDGESKPEETEAAQEGEESTDDKPAKGDRPAKDGESTEEGDDEDKPRRHRKCLAEAAGELADELNLSEGDKQDLKDLFEEGDKLYNKLDEAELDFEAKDGERPSKDGEEAPA